jgi:hypothetical protein
MVERFIAVGPHHRRIHHRDESLDYETGKISKLVFD